MIYSLLVLILHFRLLLYIHRSTVLIFSTLNSSWTLVSYLASIGTSQQNKQYGYYVLLFFTKDSTMTATKIHKQFLFPFQPLIILDTCYLYGFSIGKSQNKGNSVLLGMAAACYIPSTKKERKKKID